MKHFVFSNSLKIDNLSELVNIESLNIDRVNEIRLNSKKDVYLCRVVQFADWLLDNNLIDQLKIKQNHLMIGRGTKLFGNSYKCIKCKLIQQ